MEEIRTTRELLARRKLTRAIGDVITAQLKEYLDTLTPLFRQRAVFGENIQGPGKESPKGADQAFADLQGLYQAVATKPPFNLPRDLKAPLMQMTPSLELTPWEYEHTARADGDSKGVTVTCPFKWVLTYATYTPQRLRELLADRNRDDSLVQQFVLHYLALHVLMSKRPGLAALLEVLHYPIGSGTLAAFGGLPITTIHCAVSTGLPPDPLVLESTELSGKDAFEELVVLGDIERLRDPLRERLLELVGAQG
jgi:hypothetical protein